jgi:hypothetical protein
MTLVISPTHCHLCPGVIRSRSPMVFAVVSPHQVVVYGHVLSLSHHLACGRLYNLVTAISVLLSVAPRRYGHLLNYAQSCELRSLPRVLSLCD